jgi:hypothetical protein
MRSERRPLHLIVCAVLAVGLAVADGAAPSLAAGADDGFVITVDSPSVKLGEHAVIVATIAARDGYKITSSYRHKTRRLTALDDGVRLDGKAVDGAVQDGKVVFRIDVVPTKVGTHSVGGYFRFSLHNGQQLDIRSAPFEATVTATE